MEKRKYSRPGLFLGTFISASLLVFGIGTMASTFLPVVVMKFLDSDEFVPQLPLAEARDEEFIDIDSIPAKQLFPPISNPTNVKSGDWIHIPSVGIDVPLALSPSIEDPDVISTLEQGAALYPNGIEPGRLGNTFVAAHSTGNPWQGKYRFAFLKIGEVQPGNEISLDYKGTRYTYKITHTNIVQPDPNFRVLSDRPVPTVTLMACWPIWSVKSRMLVHAELTNITQLTVTPS